MTSKTEAKLAALREQDNRPALIGYLTLGYPSVAQTIEALNTIIEAGVDIVELGLPYTDPVMDGPVIQQAANASLEAGTRVRDVFEVIRAVHAKHPEVPILVMTYYNLILRYGVAEFARDLAAAGGAGLITPDLLPDEGAEWIAAADRTDLDRVFLVAPSSSPQRLALTKAASRGFVYAASTMGVTGVRGEVGAQARKLVADTREASAPGIEAAPGTEYVCVGLGVSTGEHVAEVGSYADGVIVGSALVQPLVSEAPWSERLADLRAVTEGLAAGLRK